MLLRYQSTLEDHIEPAVRFFRRSKTYSKQRWTEAFWAGAIGGFVAVSMSYMFLDWPMLVAAAVGFTLGPVIVLLTYDDTVSKRIAKHIKTQIGSRLPTTTEYLIENGRLRYKSYDVEITFSLQDLTDISEDSERIEFTFDDKGIALIPLRAFDNADHKKDFLACIQKEREQSEAQHPSLAAVSATSPTT
ncbi:MAG: hypothetical protein H7A49_04765 [Akkermansiaceae bacterium]|nr:hypothetical protein [Akkermansiaceae bacterium]